jgi:hypothetical protein
MKVAVEKEIVVRSRAREIPVKQLLNRELDSREGKNRDERGVMSRFCRGSRRLKTTFSRN